MVIELLQVGKPVTFTVVTHGAKGKLDAKITSPSGATDDCFITPIDDNETYSVRFIPKEQGNYFVRLDSEHFFIQSLGTHPLLERHR